jgi:hypothetical protein
MSMKPSRKIFTGGSAILTGIILQVVAAMLAMRSVANLTEQLKAAGPHSSSVTDLHLEKSHWAMAASLVGTYLGYALLVAGFLLVLIGTYQNAKSTEQLLEAVRHQPPPQVP